MKLIDNRLYLTIDDAIECGFSKDANYINKEKSRGAKWATFIKDPQDMRNTLIEFDTLTDKYKEKVLAKYPKPYDHFAKDPIRKMVLKDLQAESFYIGYIYDENKKLPFATVEKYTTAASWLNMLVKAKADTQGIKKLLGITMLEFWLQVCEVIEADNISLPGHIKRLMAKIDQYKADGYGCIIHKHYGNDHAKKIDDEVSESLLLELIAIPHADDPTTCRRYNTWAAENNKPQISIATVSNWRRKNNYLISAQKYGTRPTYNTYGKHIMRKRPSAPLLLVEHDDNELDLYFQSRVKKKGKTQVYYFNRFVIAVVIDAYNDYPLGWAIAETYSKDLIRFAYLDAVYHINELTGSWYLPHQIRSDRFGLDAGLENDLAMFYKALATYTPAAVKVARGKYIEQSFGTKWHQALGCYKNYSGNNITAKKKLNQDFREANQKDYPTIQHAPFQIANFIEVMRKLVNEDTGLSRQEQWVKAFNESELSKKHLISETQLLLKLGTSHTYTNKISNRGITPAINCVERTYEIPEEYYLQTIGKTVQVIFEPMNYSRILVTDNQGLHFIAREVELMPSAIADFKPGDRAKINDRIEEKIRHNKLMGDKKQRREDVLEAARIKAESYLQAGVHTKALNHYAMLDYQGGALPPQKQQKQIENSDGKYDPVDDM